MWNTPDTVLVRKRWHSVSATRNYIWKLRRLTYDVETGVVEEDWWRRPRPAGELVENVDQSGRELEPAQAGDDETQATAGDEPAPQTPP